MYSAIEESKVVAIISEMKEGAKAFEQYYLDTGQIVSRASSPVYFYNSGNIVKNYDSIPSWKGPYLNYESSSIANMSHPEYNVIFHALYLDDNSWGSNSVSQNYSVGACTSGKECSIWLAYSGVTKPLSFIESIDSKVDGAISATEGNFKYKYESANRFIIYLKIMPLKNPF